MPMQCERLIRLIKTWYVHVKDETMAPARMMQFIDHHVKECAECARDEELGPEVEKIREFILPEFMIPKAVRISQQGFDLDDEEDDPFELGDEDEQGKDEDEGEGEGEDDEKGEDFGEEDLDDLEEDFDADIADI